MSFLSGLTHIGGNIVGPAAEVIGGAQDFLPGHGTSQLTKLGSNITNPNVTLSNPGGILASNNPAFSGAGAYSPGYKPAAQSPSGGGGQVLGANTTTPSGTYGASGSGSGIDPYTGVSYATEQAQINGQLGNLDQQLAVGNQNIADAYNTAYNQLQGSKALADRNYQASTGQNLQNYVQARGNNQAATGQQANSLQRLLGAHGYQGSANQAAGYAAALQGTQNNNALQGNYATNQQALDTNYGDYNNQFNGQLSGLGTQRDQQARSLQAQVDSTKQSLLQQLSNLGQGNYQPQINALGQQITALGQQYASPVMQATPPVYQAPSLASYDVAPATAVQLNQSTPGASSISPIFASLLGGQQQKNLNNINS